MTLEMITTEPDYLKRVRTHLDWEKLEPGDKVAQVTDRSSYFGQRAVFYTVARLTASMIIMDDTSRWYKKSGTRRGGSPWDVLRHPQDDEVITVQQRMAYLAFTRKLEEVSWMTDATTYAQMMTIADGIDKIRASFVAQITILEGKRRKPDALPGV